MPDQREIINKSIQVYGSYIVDRFGDLWTMGNNVDKYAIAPHATQVQGPSGITSIYREIALSKDGFVWLLRANNATKVEGLYDVSQILYDVDGTYYLRQKDGSFWIYTPNDQTALHHIPSLKGAIYVYQHKYLKRIAPSCFIVKDDGTLWLLNSYNAIQMYYRIGYIYTKSEYLYDKIENVAMVFSIGTYSGLHIIGKDGSLGYLSDINPAHDPRYSMNIYKKIAVAKNIKGYIPSKPNIVVDSNDMFWSFTREDSLTQFPELNAISQKHNFSDSSNIYDLYNMISRNRNINFDVIGSISKIDGDIIHATDGTIYQVSRVDLIILDYHDLQSVQDGAYILNDQSVWKQTSRDNNNIVCIFREGIKESEFASYEDSEYLGELTQTKPISITGKLNAMSDCRWYSVDVCAGDYNISIPDNISGTRITGYWVNARYYSIASVQGSFSIREDQLVYFMVDHNIEKSFRVDNYTIQIEKRDFVGKTKLSMSVDSCLLLTEDGSVWKWNASQALSQVEHIKHAKDISGGAVLLNNGSVLVRDGRRPGQQIIHPRHYNIVQYEEITVSYDVTLSSDGVLRVMGGTVIIGTNVKAFCVSRLSVLWINNDNKIWFCYDLRTPSKIQVDSPGNIVQLSNLYVLTDDKRVWSFVYDKTATHMWSWSIIPELNNIKSISYNNFLDEDGNVWEKKRNAITQISLSDVKLIAGGTALSLAMKHDGSIWGWGKNIFCTDMPGVPSFKDPVACMGMTGPADDHPADFKDLPIIYLPEDETPITMTGVIDYATDNDSFAIGTKLDSRYKIEFTCDSPHVKTELYRGSKRIRANENLPLEEVVLKDSIFQIRVYHLANKPFTAANYTIKLTRKIDLTRESTPLNVVNGQTYFVPLYGQEIPFITDSLLDRIHVRYNPSALSLVNTHVQNEHYPFWHNITLLEESPGKLVLRKNRRAWGGEWTGLISALEFKALTTGTTQIETICEF